MAIPTKNIIKSLIYIYLIIFPFGQLLRIEKYFLGNKIVILPIDILAILSFLIIVFGRLKYPKFTSTIIFFLYAALFSLVLSISIFGYKHLLSGGLYLLRLVAYFSLFVMSWNLFREESRVKRSIYNFVLLSIIFTAILGLIQYIWFPDLRFMTISGWDDHLFRMVGTFFDPGYIGIILVIGLILALVNYQKEGKLLYFLLAIFLICCIALTYSRATYLALLISFMTLILRFKNLFFSILVISLGFLVLVSFLPRAQSSGTQLERTYSIFLRINNYKETVYIWKKSPVFGIGYNNLCIARLYFLNKDNFSSHSCFGSDSSLLFLLATTGIVGLLLFSSLFINIFKEVSSNYFGDTFRLIVISIIVQSLFVNSLFYSWIMGLLAILGAMSQRFSSLDKIKE